MPLRGAAEGSLSRVPATLTFTSPRAWSYCIWACKLSGPVSRDRVIQGVRNALANRLLDIYERTHSPGRRGLKRACPTQDARLSRRSFWAGWRSNNQRMIEAGMDSLKWLVAEQHRDDG